MACRSATVVAFVLLCAATASAELPTRGLSYGWVHNSDPFAGRPFNDHAEATTDAIGGGPYWEWRNGVEIHLWFGIKQDHITRVGDAYSAAATFIVMRKHRRRR